MLFETVPMFSCLRSQSCFKLSSNILVLRLITCKNSFSLVLLRGVFAVSSSSVSSPPLFFSVGVIRVRLASRSSSLSDRLSLPPSSSLVVRRPVFVCFVACASSFVSLCLCPIFCLPHGSAEFSDSVFSHPFASPRREENACFSDACLFSIITTKKDFSFFWMRHHIEVEWSSAAVIANMCRRVAYLLEVKRPTVFSLRDPWRFQRWSARKDATRFAFEQCRDDVVATKRSDAESQRSLIWMIVMRRSRNYVDQICVTLNLASRWNGWSTPPWFRHFRATHVNSGGRETTGLFRMCIGHLTRWSVSMCHQVGFCIEAPLCCRHGVRSGNIFGMPIRPVCGFRCVQCVNRCVLLSEVLRAGFFGLAVMVANISCDPHKCWESNAQPCFCMNSGDSRVGARGRMPPSWLCKDQCCDDGCANRLHDESSDFWSGCLWFSSAWWVGLPIWVFDFGHRIGMACPAAMLANSFVHSTHVNSGGRETTSIV